MAKFVVLLSLVCLALLVAAQNEEDPPKKSTSQKIKSAAASLKQKVTGNKKEAVLESKKGRFNDEPKRELKDKMARPPAHKEEPEKKLVREMMEPMMQMVDWDKSQLGPHGRLPDFFQAFGCMNETHLFGVLYIAKTCNEEAETWAAEMTAKHFSDEGNANQKGQKHRQDRIKNFFRLEHMMKCFVNTVSSKDANSNASSNATAPDFSHFKKEVISGLNLSDEQKVSANIALEQCMTTTRLNSIRLHHLIDRMARESDIMSKLVSTLIDAISENKSLDEAYLVKEVKELFPIVNSMICLTSSVANNGCMVTHKKPAAPLKNESKKSRA